MAWISGIFSKPEEHEKKVVGANSTLTKKGRKKAVHEMTQEEKTWHFAEARFNWLIKSGYNPNVHVKPLDKPDKPLSTYRKMMNKVHKVCDDRGERNINRPTKKKFDGTIDRSDVNKYGIRTANYGF